MVLRRHLWRWLLEVEGGHGPVKHGEINGNRYRSASLSFVSSVHATRVKMLVDTTELLLEHAHVRRMGSSELNRWLRCRSNNTHIG